MISAGHNIVNLPNDNNEATSAATNNGTKNELTIDQNPNPYMGNKLYGTPKKLNTPNIEQRSPQRKKHHG